MILAYWRQLNEGREAGFCSISFMKTLWLSLCSLLTQFYQSRGNKRLIHHNWTADLSAPFCALTAHQMAATGSAVLDLTRGSNLDSFA